ncbi:FCS-Like Zinc finger 5-like [Nicotiana tomentosiformis]|uniref:FCS-Like Zinc finger 5-like n=1 Tax=Nicotiana tomentosiformis TaxID=4098 RepID=UPI00051C095C|nr:FCS-Like Zinc finger 5-like [Nicotiana tomentosiformis]
MILGKMGRRPSMRRTTSMTGITVDVVNAGEPEPSDVVDEFKVANGYDNNQNSIAIVLPRYYHQRSSSVGFQIEETAHFLKTCGLCNRRLAPGRDIYMYRGDTAFCSMECREQQLKKDERKEKLKIILSKKTENHHNHSELPLANSETSGKSESIAAV